MMVFSIVALQTFKFLSVRLSGLQHEDNHSITLFVLKSKKIKKSEEIIYSDRTERVRGCCSAAHWFGLLTVVNVSDWIWQWLIDVKKMILKFHLIWGRELMCEDGSRAGRMKNSDCVWPATCSCQVKGVFWGELMEKQPWAMTLSWLGIHHHCSQVENDPFKHSVTGSLQINMQGMGIWVHMCAYSGIHTLITLWQ